MLVLPGCELFQPIELVGCPGNDNCPTDSGDADVDTDTDTDTDADTDTEPLPPSSGFAWATSDGTYTATWPDGSVIFSRSGQSTGLQAIAFDPQREQLAVATENELLFLGETSSQDGTAQPLDDKVREILEVDGNIYVAYTQGVAGMVGGQLSWLGAPGQVSDVAGIADAGNGQLFLVDLDDTDSGPDSYLFDPSSGDLVMIDRDFDTSKDRSRYVLADAGNALWVCSRAGAATTVSELASGNKEPAILPEQILNDVLGCDYDIGSGELMVFSAQDGLIRVDGSGATTGTIQTSDRLLAGSAWADN